MEDNFERAKRITSDWPDWKKNYQLTSNSPPKYKDPYIKLDEGRLMFNCHCADWPYFWPGWVGGYSDFTKTRGQPFDELLELRETTMLEI